jgi:hypothetical protein
MLHLLLQLAPLLPPAPILDSPKPEASDLLATVVTAPTWTQEDLERWHPRDDVENRELAAAVATADLATLRFLALAGAGVEAQSPLGRHLYRAACSWLPETEALACLLAPSAPTIDQAPALAWLAVSTERPTSLRAVALGRLLEAGHLAAWPLAEAMLLSGTAADDPTAPGADWARSGRYELPKRLLLASAESLFLKAGQTMPVVEPNAAWKVQEKQVANLRAALQSLDLPAPEVMFIGLEEEAPGLSAKRNRARAAAALLGG